MLNNVKGLLNKPKVEIPEYAPSYRPYDPGNIYHYNITVLVLPKFQKQQFEARMSLNLPEFKPTYPSSASSQQKDSQSDNMAVRTDANSLFSSQTAKNPLTSF
jgi:hypothetical protein